jgi:hypothetical protein
MDGSAKLSPQQLIESLRLEFEQALSRVADAVNAAPDGRVISGSEHQVKDLMDSLRAKVFQRVLQLKADSVESAFSPGGPGVGPADAEQGAIGAFAADGVRAGGTAAAKVARSRRRRDGAGRRGTGCDRLADHGGDS